MKKRLVFFMYVDTEFKDSPIYDLHLANLEKYSYVFDAATLYFSVKEINEGNLEMMRNLTKRFVDAGFVKELETKTRINTEFREVDCFKEEIVERIKNHTEELVFFAHSKGLSNELNWSLFRWINSMYFFALNYMDELMEKMTYRAIPDTYRGSCVLFGFPLMKCGIEQYLKNRLFYAGTMYWLNTAKVAHYNRIWNIDPDRDYIYSTRCFAEEFPGDFFLPQALGQHGPAFDEKYSLYIAFDAQLELYYNSFDSTKERVDFDNHCSYIMEKTGLKL